MNIHDKIIMALTPGSVFNRNEKIFRSLSTLAQFAGVEEDELVDLLAGEDLSPLVTCKPSAVPGKGILVALTANIPPAPAEGEPVQILGGNALQPGQAAEQPLDEDLDEVEEADPEAAAALPPVDYI